MATNPHEPAFPVVLHERTGREGYSQIAIEHPGISIRDYFAAHAIGGFIAKYGNSGISWASEAYQHADQMMLEREKGEDKS